MGVKKFHQYLFGRTFLLRTDHRPLTKIFGPKTDIPSMATARMLRWALQSVPPENDPERTYINLCPDDVTAPMRLIIPLTDELSAPYM
jgi:hypothetical protein